MLNKIKVKVVAGVLLVFLVGVLFGAVGTSAFIVRRMRQFAEGSTHMRRPWLMRQLSRRVDITEEQKPEVQRILEHSEEEIARLVQRSLAEFADIMERQRTELRTILTPEQQQKLDEHFERLRRHWISSDHQENE